MLDRTLTTPNNIKKLSLLHLYLNELSIFERTCPQSKELGEKINFEDNHKQLLMYLIAAYGKRK